MWRAGTPWDRAQETELRGYVDRGVSIRVTASSMGRTETAIRCRMDKMGIGDYARSPEVLSLQRDLKATEAALLYMKARVDALRREALAKTAKTDMRYVICNQANGDLRKKRGELEAEAKGLKEENTDLRRIVGEVALALTNSIGNPKWGPEARLVWGHRTDNLVDHGALFDAVRKAHR